jgi:hypothetical protein
MNIGQLRFPGCPENRNRKADLRRGRPHPSRLRPRLAQPTAPCDISVVFYTESEDGKPSRRAWDISQYLPSPRATGHRWDEETVALKHNWFERKVSGRTWHGYAKLRYGTDVWGWEMPWWGRDGRSAENSRWDGTMHARFSRRSI